MKKETEFEPALRQVISQTFIDTPAPRKTRYRIIHPDLNTLKNAEDNLSIVLCVSERKTGLVERLDGKWSYLFDCFVNIRFLAISCDSAI